MKRCIILALLLSFCSFSPNLISQTPIEEAEQVDDAENQGQDDVTTDIDDSFDDFEESDGVTTEASGPIGTDYEVDIAEGTIETYEDKFDRIDSYFADLDNLINDVNVPLGEL
jgi:hypothetical protein